MSKYQKLQRTYAVNVIIINFISILFLGGIWVFHEYRQFKNEIRKLKDEFIENQKTTIRNEVENAITYIDNVNKNTEKELKSILQLRSSEILQIINSFYKNDESIKNTNEADIRKLLLKLNRYNTTHDIFIFKQNKLEDLNPGKHQGVIFPFDQANLNILRKKSKSAKNSTAKIFEHSWISNDNKKNKLVAYVQYFEPLDWLVGVAIDYNEFVRARQYDVIHRLSHVRYGKSREGYLFANLQNADPLLTNGIITIGQPNNWNLQDPYGVKIIQEQKKAAQKKEGDFIYYSWRKIFTQEEKAYGIEKPTSLKVSFIKGYEPWNWMIGAGFYMDDSDLIIAQKRELLHKTIKNHIIVISVTLIVSILLTSTLVRIIGNRVAFNFRLFTRFFNEATTGNARINMDQIYFQEFIKLAVYANKMVEQRLLAEHGFKQIVEFSPFPICILKNNKNIFLNQQWLKLIGYSASEIPSIAKMLVKCFPENEEKQVLKQITSGKADTVVIDSDKLFKISCKDGSIRFMKMNFIEMKDSRMMITLDDYTFRKKIEDELNAARLKAEESDSLKSAFLANMSHEIRTPMNAIVGFAGLLQNTDLPEEKRTRYLALIQKSSETLLNLINDILDISKIEAGQLTFQKINGNLEELFTIVDAEIKSIRSTMGKNEIQIKSDNRLQYEEGFIETDFLRLKQVMMNLLSNALKFTTTGTIEYGCEILNKDTLRFFVRDSGIGIKQSNLKDIFNRFTKIEEDTTRIFRGAGLGLAISSKIIEAMNGSIWAESKFGEGSTFWFTIPYNQTGKTYRKTTTA